MQQQVGLLQLFERGAEGGDQLGGQLLDEADRVREQHGVRLIEAAAAGGGVERLEEAVAGAHLGVGQRVYQGALAGVGVADQRDQGDAGAVAPAALLAALGAHLLKVFLEPLDLVADQAAVGLQLGFAGAARADRALHPLEVGPLPGQARQQILVLRQRHLHRAFAGARALGEDVQDERGAVDDLAAEPLLQRALLRGGELVVADHDAGAQLAAHGGNLFQLAFADPGAWIGVRAALDDAGKRDGAGGFGQLGEFVD